jgi:hypothetical protein
VSCTLRQSGPNSRGQLLTPIRVTPWALPNTAEQGERLEVWQAAQGIGAEEDAGPTGRGDDIGPEVEPRGTEAVCVVKGNLALEPRHVGAGTRVELRPRRVTDKPRHHLEDASQLRPLQLRRWHEDGSRSSCLAETVLGNMKMGVEPERGDRRKTRAASLTNFLESAGSGSRENILL